MLLNGLILCTARRTVTGMIPFANEHAHDAYHSFFWLRAVAKVLYIKLEHFTIIDDKITVKPNKELKCSMLQSPDDIDATYRKKQGRHYRGQSVNVTETANPDNDVNLLTDVAVYSNDTDDSKILNDRLDPIKAKTPDLNELHTDGAYGSEDNDKKMEELQITHVQTAVRGRKAEVSMKIEEASEEQYTVKCPH